MLLSERKYWFSRKAGAEVGLKPHCVWADRPNHGTREHPQLCSSWGSHVSSYCFMSLLSKFIEIVLQGKGCSYFFSECVILGALLLQADAAQSSCPLVQSQPLISSLHLSPGPTLYSRMPGFHKNGPALHIPLSYCELAPLPETPLLGFILWDKAFYPVVISIWRQCSEVESVLPNWVIWDKSLIPA